MSKKRNCYSCLKLWSKLEKSFKHDGHDGELIGSALNQLKVLYNGFIRPSYTSGAVMVVAILIG